MGTVLLSAASILWLVPTARTAAELKHGNTLDQLGGWEPKLASQQRMMAQFINLARPILNEGVADELFRMSRSSFRVALDFTCSEELGLPPANTWDTEAQFQEHLQNCTKPKNANYYKNPAWANIFAAEAIIPRLLMNSAFSFEATLDAAQKGNLTSDAPAASIIVYHGRCYGPVVNNPKCYGAMQNRSTVTSNNSFFILTSDYGPCEDDGQLHGPSFRDHPLLVNFGTLEAESECFDPYKDVVIPTSNFVLAGVY
jgi:hypothetical protein